MARTPRREVFDESRLGMYHCVNRCVRRAFLCGQDPLTGNNFDHRKDWFRNRLEFLAGQFALEVAGYSVMSNHIHVVVRNRPDVGAEWTDEDVARRWWNVFPARKDELGQPAQPQRHELDMLMADRHRMAELRRRLADVSWFMRCLCEDVARKANREDGCKGRFFEGRFKCQALLDESAILACSVYVDLNPVRAGVAATPETSQYTSVYDRIKARQGGAKDQRPSSPSAKRGRKRRETARPSEAADGWLCPVKLNEKRASPTRRRGPHRRATDMGFLPIRLDDYLQLVDWTGRQVRREKQGRIPAELAPILDRLQVNSSTWLDSVRNFGRWFRRAAGRRTSLAAEAARTNRRWLHGTRASETAFL